MKRFGILFLVCAVGICGYIIFFKSPVFRVQTVLCVVDDNGSCPEGVKEEVEREKNVPLFAVPTKSIEKKIQHAVSSIESIQIQKNLPHTLRVILTLRQPAFLVQQENSSSYFQVDATGKLYRSIDDPGKSIVVQLPPDQQWNVGSVIPKETTEVLVLFVHSLQNFSQLVSSLRYNSKDEIILSFADGRKGIVKSGSAQQQLDTLQHILNDATIDTQQRMIDVRFAHPVIR